MPIPPTAYLATQPRVLLTYLRLLFLPWNQNLDYDYPIFQSVWHVPALAGLCVLALMVAAGVVLMRGRPLAAFGIFWFLIGLSVESSFVPIRNVICEYRLYLPLAGWCFLVMACVGRQRRLGALGRAALAAVVALLGCMAYARNEAWRTERSLGQDMVRKSPRKARPHAYLGVALLKTGDWRGALHCADRVIALDPDLAPGWGLRGDAWLEAGDYGRALADYGRALRLEPGRPEVLYNRGVAHARAGRPDLAIEDFTATLARRPDHVLAWLSRGSAYMMLREHDRAIEDYGRALRLDPSAEVFRRRARAWLEKGDAEKARQDYERCRRLGGRDDALRERIEAAPGQAKPRL